jgi:hypothetical protein
MHRKDDQGRGDFEDAFSPVQHASGFRMILALATQNNMHCDHDDDDFCGRGETGRSPSRDS